jgi:hypothetical protein
MGTLKKWLHALRVLWKSYRGPDNVPQLPPPKPVTPESEEERNRRESEYYEALDRAGALEGTSGNDEWDERDRQRRFGGEAATDDGEKSDGPA